jgi:hypothetical protein
MESGATLRAADAMKLPKPVKVPLRPSDKVAKSLEELLKWIKHMNPGLHIDH